MEIWLSAYATSKQQEGEQQNYPEPQIPLCRQDQVNKTERDFYRNISHKKTGGTTLK